MKLALVVVSIPVIVPRLLEAPVISIAVIRAAKRTYRRDLVTHAEGIQRLVLAWPQCYAATAKVRMLADFPNPALDDSRSRAVVEARVVEVLDRAVGGERSPVHPLAIEQSDLRRCDT